MQSASPASPWIHAAAAASFADLVLANSRRGPVLVNFWSEKAGPCLRQYPLLDKLVHHYDGRLLLINVDADREAGIAREYGVNSVPTLKLFRHGEVVETLHGYQSESDLLRCLDRHVARDSDRQLARAIEHYARGESQRAYVQITEAILDDPDNPRLPLALAKLLRHEGRTREALDLLDKLPAAVAADGDIRAFRQRLEFQVIADTIADAEDLARKAAGSDDLNLKKQLSAQQVLADEPAQALATLAEMMAIDPHFEDDYPRKAMLGIFQLLKEEDALIGEYRPLLRRYYA